MLVTFKCPASPEITMLENLAQYLLGIVGKRLGERGVIYHDELSGAIAKLEAAIGADRTAEAEHLGLHHDDEWDHASHAPVGLARRAYPFLDMMREAHKQNADILWGV